MAANAVFRVPVLLAALMGVNPALWADSAGGLRWTASSEWQSQGSRPMRAAQYAIPAASGDSEAGECAVYYFGEGQGGSVEANVKRWISQFRTPDGGPADSLAKTSNKTINGIDITIVEVTGTYMFKPFPMAPQATPKPGYRMLAAIVEGPLAPVFFKLTGPKKTAQAAEPQFHEMLESIRKE